MTQDTKQEEKRTAVYVPYKTFLTSLEILGQGLPDEIDPSAWQSFSGGVRSQVLSAYKFLGLIDEHGNTQDSLRELIEKKAARKELLTKLLTDKYALVVARAKSNATQSQFEEEMRKYNVSGETMEKAIRFYLAAAAALGLPLSTLWSKKAKGVRRAGAKRKSTTGTRSSDDDDDDDDDDEQPAGDSVDLDFDGAGTLTLSVSIAPTKLPKAHRDFVFKLIDDVNEYKEKMREPKAAINGRIVPAVLEEPK